MHELLNVLYYSLKRKSVFLALILIILFDLITYIKQHDELFRYFNDVHIYIASVSILLFFYINEIINREITQETNKHLQSPKKIVLLAKLGKYLTATIFVIGIPSWLLASEINRTYNEFKNAKQNCIENLKKTGIIIASFSRPKEEMDGFSSTLYGKLNADIQHIDTLNLQTTDKYISDSTKSYLEDIKDAFAQKCSSTGLIIFGNRKGNNYFNCRIYSLNFSNFRVKNAFRTKDSTVIYIENPFNVDQPRYIEFTIDHEANVVADFIYGLLYNHIGDYMSSIRLINKALHENKNPSNSQFISICHLFIGNNLYYEGKFADARKEYSLGINKSASNEYLHFNLAQLYRIQGDIPKAYNEFEKATKLNTTFKNPLHLIETLNALALAKITLHKNHPPKIVVIKNSYADNQKEVKVPQDWEERCYTITQNNKYGVINNRGDTIVSCKYEAIESFPYKGADCYIIKENNKYGAIIHLHEVDGYTRYAIKNEYPSTYRVEDQIRYCLDNHRLK